MYTKSMSVAGMLIVLLTANLAVAECPVAHTHIGVNPTWRPDWSDPGNPDKATDPDPTDDNKLWFFSIPPVHPVAPTPGWPSWEHENGQIFLVVQLYLGNDEPITKPGDPNKMLYNCSFIYSAEQGYGDPCGLQHLDGWHSADGPQGKWNLQSIDQSTVPDWDIWLKRESTSVAEDDFFMLLPNETAVLTSNGDVYQLGKEWQSDEDAWGIHEHMGFYFWLDEYDEQVSVTLSCFDTSGMYERSADFTMRFAREVCDPVQGDFDGDCVVDFKDFALMANHWLESGYYGG